MQREPSPAEFAQALETVYVRNPCGVLPNALWKTLREIESCRRRLSGSMAEPDALMLWDERRLLVAWTADGAITPTIEDRLRRSDLALLHEKMVPPAGLSRFSHQEDFFRLSIDLGQAAPCKRPPTLDAVPANLPEDAAKIASFVSSCYEGIRLSEEHVVAWSEHPPFSPDLWIWIRETRSGRTVALGIAEHDPSIEDVSLEWIQVCRSARRRGIGRALVGELLERGRALGRIATVSGQVGSAAERLYRSCGFSGDDVWWCVRT